MSRALRLRRETLAELAAGELAAVAGGKPDIPTWDSCPLTGAYLTLPVRYCLEVQTTA